MARFAAFCLDRLMFENERSLLVRVAGDANAIPCCGRSKLLADESAMRVMAIRTLHQAFFHTMMKRHIELRFFVQMAAVELRLLLDQQKLLRARMMGGMATQAAQVVFAMSGARKIRLVLARRMAIQAARAAMPRKKQS